MGVLFRNHYFAKQLFRKTTISKNNYFASCVMQLLFRKKNYFEKLLFRKKKLFRKTTISQNYYFASCVMQLLFRSHYFAKLLFRKTTISQNYYSEKKLFRKKKTISQNFYFEKTTISQVV